MYMYMIPVCQASCTPSIKLSTKNSSTATATENDVTSYLYDWLECFGHHDGIFREFS